MGCKKNVRVTCVKTKCSPGVPARLFPPKNAGLEGRNQGVEAETAVARDDFLGLRVV